MSWTTKSSKEIYKSNWMTVTEDQVLTSTGKELTWSVVHKKDFALIIPWDGNKFTLVGVYRYPIGQFSWEFPQGHMEGDNIFETANEELQEETGLIADKVEKLGDFHLANGFLDQKCHTFLATGLKPGNSNREAGEEDMKIKEVTMKEIENMIVEGEIKDGPTITALMLFKFWRREK
ncbi:MAG TPA: NUDIX hydrolase [Alphaproteobacteria bacterium]|jgi:8-oxo-dGTP pyrophosphatase MutT (NUDIX family)|nr:NUDIX hydrolase [Alphaproteobacteria bacterium]